MEKTDVLDRRVRLEDIYATLVNAAAKTRNESTQKDAALTPAIDPRIETAKLIDESTVFAIIAEAEEAVKSEPNVLELDAPVTICGDVHGQFLDLIKLFRTAGGGLLHDTPKTPSQTRRLPNRILRGLKAEPRNDSTFLFLGDYVDRGPDSFACMIYLLALKGAFPERIFLLRGNHECRCMTSRKYDEGQNFREECLRLYSEDVYERFMACFDCLPIACLATSPIGKWLCLHGGISPHLHSVDDIRALDRFREPPLTGLFCDLLWSDPFNEEVTETFNDKDYQEFLELDFLPNPPRGCSYLYGYEALRVFLGENSLTGIIRAHQCIENGVGYHFAATRKEKFPFPLVTTVFSAPNYCGMYDNVAAVVRLTKDDMQVKRFSSADEKDRREILASAIPVMLRDEVLATLSREPSERFMSVHLERKRRRSSAKFQSAVARDASSDVHPGWQTLRRWQKVVGRFGVMLKQTSRSRLAATARDVETSPVIPEDEVVADDDAVEPARRRRSGVVSNDTKTEVEEFMAAMKQTKQSTLRRSLSENLNTDDVRQMQLVFDAIDVNRDGFVSTSELRQFASDVGEYCDADSQVAEMISGMDTDGDGKVSFKEFTKYIGRLTGKEAKGYEQARRYSLVTPLSSSSTE